jgi:hypothetical protein
VKILRCRGILLAFFALKSNWDAIVDCRRQSSTPGIDSKFIRGRMLETTLRDISCSDNDYQQRLEEEMEDYCCIHPRPNTRPGRTGSLDWPTSSKIWSIISQDYPEIKKRGL